MSRQEEIQDKELEDIRYILKDFLKVIKVVTMYPEDNPLPQSLKQSFSEKLESVANEYGPINIVVEKEFLVYKNEVVFRDRSKEESLAGLFFNTGITRFTMQPTLSVDEIYKLLDTFKDFLNAPKNSCDLAGLIWEAELSDFSFSTVEDIALSGYDGKIEEQFISGGSSGTPADHSLFGSDETVDYGSILTMPLCHLTQWNLHSPLRQTWMILLLKEYLRAAQSFTPMSTGILMMNDLLK